MATIYFGYKYYLKRKAAKEQSTDSKAGQQSEETKEKTPGAVTQSVTTRAIKEAERLLEAFHCPISQQLIEDPVGSKYGHVYEKKEIERWVEKYHTCPMTNQPLELSELFP